MRLPVYLDHHATTPLDPQVFEAMRAALLEDFGNPASRDHLYGRRAERAVEAARASVARLVGAEASEIIFTSGATESNNLALQGAALANHEKGGHLLSVATEHPAVLEPLRALQKRQGFRVTFLPVESDGRIDLEAYERAIESGTVLVSVMWANNEIGVIQPIAQMADIAHRRGALFHTDATQAVGKVQVDLKAAGVDSASFTAHKLYGPKGAGALYTRRATPRMRLAPVLFGGGHEGGMRPGTLNVPGIVGFARACELAEAHLPQESERLLGLRRRLWEGFRNRLDAVQLNGHAEERLPGNLHVSFDRIESQALLTGLSAEIAASSGAACASGRPFEISHVMRAIGAEARARSSVRFGLGRFNTEEEIDFVLERLVDRVGKLRQFAGKV